jgi:hypothetical protein
MQHHQFLLVGLALSAFGCDGKDGGTATASTSTPPPAAVAACPSAYNQLSQRDGEATCTCAPAAVRGSVYGSGVYTTDSSICAAARHAGAIAEAGGDVTVKATKGCGTYAASTANGITTRSWGAYGSSFYFPSKGDGTCPAPVAATTEPCPASWDRVPNAATTSRLSCSCATVPPSGAVYGTSMYTSDSSICRAAVHAGAIPPTGGTVTVVRAAGCPSFKNTEANGISSSSWGQFPLSFYFEGHGTGACGA